MTTKRDEVAALIRSRIADDAWPRSPSAAGLTQSQLAELLGVSVTWVGHAPQGRRTH